MGIEIQQADDFEIDGFASDIISGVCSLLSAACAYVKD
jgi:hypothetical protein